MTDDERKKAIASIKDPNLKGDETAIRNAVLNDRIEKAVQGSEWSVGGDNRRIVESGTALIQGLVSGDVNKAVANASAPYIANQIAKNIGEKNKAGRLAAHGIANVALALAKGENAGAQSLGAMTGEAMGMLSVELYGKTVGELTEDEKATVSAFASLAAGIAGGLVGGDTSSAGNAAEAGKTTVENNFLHAEKIITFVGEFANAKTPEEKKQLQQDIDKLDKKLQSQAEGWGISTNDMRSALAGLKALEGLPDCNVQCQEMVRDSISKLEPALENRINNHSSQTENLKELTGILVTVIVMNESGLIDGVSKGNNTSSVTKPNVTTKPNEQIPPKTVPNQTGGDKLGNYQVHDLKQVTDPALNLNVIRQETKDYLKLGAQKDNSAVSYATASVTVNGKTEYYLSVSGKSWSGQSPDTVNISGINYKVIRDDKNSFTSVGDIEAKRTNFNHAEQKLFNHIQDSYKGQKAEVNMAIQNTSQNKQGMCVSCGYTSQNFAENNKNLKVNIYQGSTGENK
ncbi:VENN motif pre-toxin domain-containing protein [Providencia rettgeri]|nr:VENN motif pre-toxin domain-containing protein [Providencia rettgeri]